MFLETKSMTFAINKRLSKKKKSAVFYYYAWHVLAAMSTDPNHISNRSIHKHTSTFSEFTIVWLNALDESRWIKTLQRWKGLKALSSVQPAGSHFCHTLPSTRIHPREHSISVHISYIVQITDTVITNTHTHI